MKKKKIFGGKPVFSGKKIFGGNAVLGVDIGYDRLKLALMRDGKIRKTISVAMPENMLREGRIVSPDAMADFLREVLKKNHIRVTNAALVLSDEPLYIRSLFMPPMPEDQLVYNLPYEFNDYITGELKDYAFDYAVLHLPREQKQTEENAESETGSAPEAPESLGTLKEGSVDASDAGAQEFPDAMELLAVAAPEAMLLEGRDMMRKAGLHLVRAAPVECAFIALIRAAEYGRAPKPLEYCFLDLGYQTIRMHMFRGVRHMATRALDFGLSTLDDVIAEAFHVDVHLAHTYLLSNYEDCQNQDYCQRAYNNIAVELMRALNFFRFSNPHSHLSGVWVFGGGAVIEPLRKAITDTLDLKVHQITGMIPGGKDIEESYSFAPAVGITEAFPGANKSFIQKRRNLPFKVSINMAALLEKRLPILATVAIAAAVVIGAALFGKFAVYDLLRDAEQARREVETVQRQLEAGYEKIETFGEVNDLYSHYTTSDMTEEELKRADRLEVMRMLREVVLPRTPLDAWSLSGNQLTMSISGSTLEAINETAKAIRAQEMVDYCTVNTASTASGNVTANIVIYLKDNPRMDEGGIS